MAGNRLCAVFFYCPGSAAVLYLSCILKCIEIVKKGYAMEISLLLMQQIAELVLMIFMGYVIVKAGL